MRAIADTIEAENNPEPAAALLGLHLEGPYINPKYKARSRNGASAIPILTSAVSCWTLLPGASRL
jgi:N-acetylglucosamine-6-phosphate deacetylase